MPRYMVFTRAPADAAEFELEIDADASLTERNEQMMESVGLQLVDLYYLTGKYWAVGVVEAPDDRTVARAVRTVYGTDSDVQPEFVPAISADELG